MDLPFARAGRREPEVKEPVLAPRGLRQQFQRHKQIRAGAIDVILALAAGTSVLAFGGVEGG